MGKKNKKYKNDLSLHALTIVTHGMKCLFLVIASLLFTMNLNATQTYGECVIDTKQGIESAFYINKNLSDDEIQVINNMTEEERLVAHKLAGLDYVSATDLHVYAQSLGLRHDFHETFSLEPPTDNPLESE